MNDYKPNSHRFKEEQKEPSVEKKQIQKVVKGPVRKKKKSSLSNFIDTFVSEDVASIKNYVLMDILVPAIRDAIYDVGKGALDMILYGEKGRSTSRSTASKVSYRQYYDKGESVARSSNRRTQTRLRYDDVVYVNEDDADDVLDEMTNVLEAYGAVSVADLCELIGDENIASSYTDNKYGWESMRNIRKVKVRDGWIIEFPKLTPLR